MIPIGENTYIPTVKLIPLAVFIIFIFICLLSNNVEPIPKDEIIMNQEEYRRKLKRLINTLKK